MQSKQITTKISKTSEGEFRIRLFINGVYQPGADYFASDKKEAVATAKAMQERGVETDKTTEHAKGEARDFREEQEEGESDND